MCKSSAIVYCMFDIMISAKYIKGKISIHDPPLLGSIPPPSLPPTIQLNNAHMNTSFTRAFQCRLPIIGAPCVFSTALFIGSLFLYKKLLLTSTFLLLIFVCEEWLMFLEVCSLHRYAERVAWVLSRLVIFKTYAN